MLVHYGIVLLSHDFPRLSLEKENHQPTTLESSVKYGDPFRPNANRDILVASLKAENACGGNIVLEKGLLPFSFFLQMLYNFLKCSLNF